MGERTWVSSFKEYPYYGRHIDFCFKKRHEKLIFVTLIAMRVFPKNNSSYIAILILK
jgi:hypothetical protein